ncbi:MAG: DUF1080 domain-containing protein [Planctomycetota bacterium]|nr:DUF1080 domain-containing protein [Planctomycetota bacterium]
MLRLMLSFRGLFMFRILLLVICAACSASSPKAPQDTQGWLQLFNGHDLSGWTPKIVGQPAGQDERKIFRVEDGLLKVSYDGYETFEGTFGHLFYETPFSHYRLRIVYRFTGEQTPGGPGWAWRNSGVMLHGQSPESMLRDQEFPVSLELQMLGGDGTHSRPTANLCTPGTDVDMAGRAVDRHCINSSSATFAGDVWVTVEAEVHGGEWVRHLVDDHVVLEYTRMRYDPDDPEARRLEQFPEKWLSRGYLSLQAESHPVEFLRVELLPLESGTP